MSDRKQRVIDELNAWNAELRRANDAMRSRLEKHEERGRRLIKLGRLTLWWRNTDNAG